MQKLELEPEGADGPHRQARPGQEAQVDFGKMELMLDPDTGRVRSLWALIITLSFGATSSCGLRSCR